MSSEARRFEKECYAVIWGINIFVNFVTMLLCFHYARVFYSLYLDKTFATGASQGAPPFPRPLLRERRLAVLTRAAVAAGNIASTVAGLGGSGGGGGSDLAHVKMDDSDTSARP